MNRCFACARIGGPMWTVLRERVAGENVKAGHPVLLCSRCVLVCPTCGKPAVTATAWSRFPRETRPRGTAPLRRGMWWATEPCRNGRHERPGLRDAPHELKIDTRGAPDKPKPMPEWCWVGDECRGIHTGDQVLVGTGAGDEIGTVRWISSHRLGGGAALAIQFADGSWLQRRPSDVRLVEQHSTDDAGAPTQQP